MDMSWLQVLTIAGTTIGCCAFFRKETKEQISEIKKDFAAWRESNAQEMKDFHGRLCRLEEKYIQMMERFMSQDKKK